MTANGIEQVIITCLIFCLAGSMLFGNDWLKRRRLAAKFRNSSPAAPFSLPYSIEYTSTCDDLIEAYEAGRISRMSRDFRWAYIVMGWGWVILAIVTWLKVFPRVRADKWWQPLIPLTLGTGLLWFNVAKPFLRKRRIRASNPASQKLRLDFVSDGIQIQAEGVRTFKRTWDELVAVTKAKKGLLIYFTDGIVNWLPERVFQNTVEKTALYTFLYNQIPVTEESER